MENAKNANKKLDLEILSGLAFVLIAFGLKIDAYNLSLDILIRFAFIVLYLVAIFIIAGIDKEYRKIEKNVLYYAVFISCCYIIYLCIMGGTSIYRYVMYLVTLIILLGIDSIQQRKHAKESYLISNLLLVVIMSLFTGEIITCITVLTVFLAIILGRFFLYLKNAFNKSKKEYPNMLEMYKFGFLFSVTNVILLIVNLLFKIIK